jgi:hypothetical protein
MIRKWFTIKNGHYQILPKIGWTTEVYRCLEDYTFKPSHWCYNFGMSFAWISLSTGFRISGKVSLKKKSDNPCVGCGLVGSCACSECEHSWIKKYVREKDGC